MGRRSSCFTKRFLVGLILFIAFFLLNSLGHADWTPVTPPDVGPNWALNGVHFTSVKQGWAVGADYANKTGVILQYHDGTWTAVTPPEASSDWELESAHFTSAGEGWAVGVDNVGQKGVLLHYANGSWTNVTPPNVSLSWALYGVQFASASDGWAVGVDYSNQRGVLLHLVSGSWTAVVPPSVSLNWGLYGIHLITANNGWAVGVDHTNKRGALLQYLRGEKEKVNIWTVITPPEVDSDWELSHVHFISSSDGWAAGIDHTSKSGVLLHRFSNTWTVITPPEVSSDWQLSGVQFTSASEGWAVGIDRANRKGVLLQYQKGSWEVITPPEVSSDWELCGVRFTSTKEGWAVGFDRANQRGVLLRYSSSTSETVSAPVLPDGPTSGSPGTIYTFTTKGASSSLGHSIQYLFDWGDGTNSGWLSVGTTSVTKSWASPGTYIVKAQARCAAHTSVVSKWSSGLSVNISNTPASINLVSPSNGTHFEGCSLYVLPTFAWSTAESFSSYGIEFSKTENFSSITVTVKASSTSVPIDSKTWKKILLIPGTAGGPIYWRVVGTRADKTTSRSDAHSVVIDPVQAVGNPMIRDTGRSSLPTLSWDNNCNIKFQVWFGNNSNFFKKTSLSFSVKNPNENMGKFTKVLTSRQWKSVRDVVGDVSGATIYWSVESWDGANRRTRTSTPMSFVLTD